MSLLDRIIDNHDPGPVGQVNYTTPLPYVANARILGIRAIAGLALLILGVWFVAQDDNRFGAALTMAAYLVVSYFFVPQADTTNLGYLGYTDQPLRLWHWANRYLFVFRLLLWPGRFALSSIRDFVLHLRGRRSIVLYRRVDESGQGDA
jgi:hypothetical protein